MFAALFRIVWETNYNSSDSQSLFTFLLPLFKKKKKKNFVKKKDLQTSMTFSFGQHKPTTLFFLAEKHIIEVQTPNCWPHAEELNKVRRPPFFFLFTQRGSPSLSLSELAI